VATGYRDLMPNMAVLPSSSAPALAKIAGTDTGNIKQLLVLDYDASADEHASWTFIMPGDYASGGSLIVYGMINGTTAANTIMAAEVACVTPADADTPIEHAKSAAATCTIATNTTEANRLLSGTITLNMDSAAAGDLVTIVISRDADNASDTATPDFRFLGARFSYTTS